MTNSVTFPPSVGGDGSTITDDSNASTGLGNGGHRTRFIPALSQLVSVAQNTVVSSQVAADSAASAAISATNATNASGSLKSTSTTSNTVGTGSKTFTIEAGKQFAVGTFVVIANTAAPTNYMYGQVTSYTTTTLVVNILSIGGVGTFTAWTVTLAGIQGIAGTLSGTASGNIDMADYQFSRALIRDTGMVLVDKGNSSTTTQTLDYTAGSVQKITVTGNHTIAITNWPPTGNMGIIQLELVNAGAYTITWPTINWIKPDGSTTTTFSTWLASVTGRVALQTSGVDKIKLESSDAGTTIYGRFA